MHQFKNFEKYLTQNQIDEIDTILINAVCDYEISSEYYDRIKISFNNRLRTTAGMFRYNVTAFDEFKESRIELNLKYLKEFGFENVKKTFAHEVAHLINLAKYRECGHGWSFKKICKELGGHMNDYHAGQTFKECSTKEFISSEYKWNYKCDCGRNDFNYRRRMGINKRNFSVCRKCSSKLTETKL